LVERGQGWQGSTAPKTERTAKCFFGAGLTPPAEAAASQKWKIIYLQVLTSILKI
jgi:hypothetical protein